MAMRVAIDLRNGELKPEHVSVKRLLANFLVPFGLLVGFLCSGCQEEAQISTYTVAKPHVVWEANHVDDYEREDVAPSSDAPFAPFANRSRPAGPKVPGRLVGMLLPHGEQTWFFKIMGRSGPVQSAMEQFVRFISTIRFGEGDDAKPEWSLPEGWQAVESPAANSPMNSRFATIRIPVSGTTLELTVTPLRTLPGDYDDYVLFNVNRWRGQVGLPPTTRDNLYNEESRTEEVRKLELRGTEVVLVNLAGEIAASEAGAEPGARLPDGHPPVGAPGPGGPASTPPASSKLLDYDVPDGWEPGRLNQFRAAAFVVKDGVRQVEITVSQAGGDLLANVNRWRGQVGLPAFTQKELAADSTTLEMDDAEGTYVTMSGTGKSGKAESILAIVVPREQTQWFFKLMGDRSLAEQEQERFEEFVRSVTFR